MRLIVGLGNPGAKFNGTRHNVGFMVMDEILKSLNLQLDKEKFKALYTIMDHKGEKIAFMKPLTYMNLSGEAVGAFCRYYNIDIEDIVVIHDDLDLPVGKVRLRTKGSSGGQNGMGNIINLLGSKDIKRIRVGIANNKNIDTKDYVLGKVNKEDKEAFDQSLLKARDAILFYLDNPDFDLVMNRFN